jgi:hypothetical protein
MDATWLAGKVGPRNTPTRKNSTPVNWIPEIVEPELIFVAGS